MTVRLKCLAPRPMASMRLLCIPFAGGGTSVFRGWADLLPAHVEAFAIQLPAREDRHREPALEHWQPMMDALTTAVARLPAQPTAVFGHSLGALIAFELGRWMQASAAGKLAHLFVSGRAWPGGAGTSHQRLRVLDDDALLRALHQQYGSLPTSLSHPDIRELALPALRADLRLLDSYRYAASAPLRCGITAFAGSGDPATNAASIDAWRQEAGNSFMTTTIGCGHFFIETGKAQLVAAIAARLRGSVASGV